jgi:hypothetical protein
VKPSAPQTRRLITVHYNGVTDGPLTHAIDQLRRTKGTTYSNRSRAAVARELLSERLTQLAHEGLIRWRAAGNQALPKYPRAKSTTTA